MTEPEETPLFEVHLPDPPPLSKGERERRAFLRLLPELLRTHAGQYVAIHNEQVVDSGPDDIALIRRVHGRMGYVPIHVGLVTELPRVRRVLVEVASDYRMTMTEDEALAFWQTVNEPAALTPAQRELSELMPGRR